MYNSTLEIRMLSIDKKINEIFTMLDEHLSEESVTNSGETKFNSNYLSCLMPSLSYTVRYCRARAKTVGAGRNKFQPVLREEPFNRHV
jgi:hypothetical protein